MHNQLAIGSAEYIIMYLYSSNNKPNLMYCNVMYPEVQNNI